MPALGTESVLSTTLTNIDVLQNLLHAVQNFSLLVHSKQLVPQKLYLPEIVSTFQNVTLSSKLTPEFFIQSAGTFLGAALVSAAQQSAAANAKTSNSPLAVGEHERIRRAPAATHGQTSEVQTEYLVASESWLLMARWSLSHTEGKATELTGQTAGEATINALQVAKLHDRIAMIYADILIRKGSVDQAAAELSSISADAKATPAALTLMVQVLVSQKRPANIVAKAVLELSSKKPRLELILDVLSSFCSMFLLASSQEYDFIALLTRIEQNAELQGMFFLPYFPVQTCASQLYTGKSVVLLWGHFAQLVAHRMEQRDSSEKMSNLGNDPLETLKGKVVARLLELNGHPATALFGDVAQAAKDDIWCVGNQCAALQVWLDQPVECFLQEILPQSAL